MSLSNSFNTFTSAKLCRRNVIYFADIDLTRSFWQKPLNEDSHELTAFVTPDGHFEHMVLPMGIKNSPGGLQCHMEKFLRTVKKSHPYFDNLLIGSPSYETHYNDVLLVLRILNEANMSINRHKSHVGKQELKSLGHIISSEGVTPDPIKVKTIKDYLVPLNRKELKSFLCRVSWVRKFIPDLATHAVYLWDSTNSEGEFQWDDKAAQDFNKLKSMISENMMLNQHDPSLPNFICQIPAM